MGKYMLSITATDGWRSKRKQGRETVPVLIRWRFTQLHTSAMGTGAGRGSLFPRLFMAKLDKK